ncbi:MAG: helix-turn-helix domain-containing protein [Chitinophagales bacterium]|nr:helix-turn-helix domain-containing protein [Chitinophagales bacterium]
MNGNTFISLPPKDKLVKKYISYYYFHKSSHDNFQQDFIYYPHYCNAITIYKDARVAWDDWRSYVTSGDTSLTILYSRNYDRCIQVSLRGQINKTGIVFKPLGLNHFVSSPLSLHSTQVVTAFNYFGTAFESELDHVYALKSNDEKVELLDQFFVGHYTPFSEQRLEKAIDQILKTNGAIECQQLADDLCCSRKTLLRLFKKHLICTPSVFKSLVRFRNTLNYYQEQHKKPSLTQLAYEHQYYDQADFIRHFKAVTGETPKLLFSKIKNLGSQNTYWTFR